MTTAELAEIGRALYGERWQTPLAAAVQVSDRTMRRWLAGDTPIPDGAAEDVRQLLARDRAERALDLIAEQQAELGKAVEIALTEGRDDIGRRATKLLKAALEARGFKVVFTPRH